MTPRLEHRKSRNGCLRCKIRKVKCSEHRPQCSSCARHKVECTYASAQPIKPSRRLEVPITDAGQSSSAASSITSSSASHEEVRDADTTLFLPAAVDDTVSPLFKDSSAESVSRRLLELRLLAHFLNVVTKTFAGYDQKMISEAWQNRLPHLALKFPFLLNTIFATAALHLAVGGSMGDDTMAEDVARGGMKNEDFAAVHTTYFGLAISQHRAAINAMSSENADAVCMTSVMIANHGFLLGSELNALVPATSPSDHGEMEEDDDNYKVPLRWLQLSTGIRDLIRHVHLSQLPSDSLIRVLMSTFNWAAVNDMLQDPSRASVFHSLLDFEAHPEPAQLPGIEVILPGQPDEELTIKEVYEQTLRYLGHIYKSIEGGENVAIVSRLCMGFASMVPRAFMRLVEEQRPRALVCLAHLYGLTAVLKDRWWFRGAADRHVKGLGNLVGPEWQWAMEWPRKAALGQGWNVST